MSSTKTMEDARKTIYDQELPLAVKRSAWCLFRHELSRINPVTEKPYTHRRALANVLKWMAGQKARQDIRYLTPAEHRVLRLLVEGLTMKQVSLELGVSFQTVKRHIRNVRRKTGLVSTYQVMAVAVAQGWVKAPGLDDV